MTKYKLVRSYPGSPELNTEVKYEQGKWRYDDNHMYVNEDVTKHPEFWKKIEEIPKYVKCIYNKGTLSNFLHLNKIYEVDLVKSNEQDLYLLDYNHTSIYKGLNTRFIPSTKEKYDEQQKPKEYEILSLKFDNFIYSYTEDGIEFYLNKQCCGGYVTFRNEINIEIAQVTIHSIKRLSDGEIFTIGDIINYNDVIHYHQKIDKINFINNILTFETLLVFVSLSTAIKAKHIPLFITNDKVNIYKGQKYYHISNWKVYKKEGDFSQVNINKIPEVYYNRFSTKEKAEEYILMNKPCLSYNDLVINNIQKDSINEFVIIRLPGLKDLINSKLNVS